MPEALTQVCCMVAEGWAQLFLTLSFCLKSRGVEEIKAEISEKKQELPRVFIQGVNNLLVPFGMTCVLNSAETDPLIC